MRTDCGTVTAFVVCFTVSLLAVTGLVVDGGFTLAARRRAFNEANAAARAGAQALDEAAFRSEGDVRLEPSRARTLALDHLRAAGLTGTVEIIGERVTVRATTTHNLAILRLAGIDSLTIDANGTARAVHGLRRGDD